jgi:hypothetical protein
MSLGKRGENRESVREVPVLVRLHETEVALRQLQTRIARHGTEDRYRLLQRRDGVGYQAVMPFAADAVENDSGDAHSRIVGRKSAQHCGG